MASQVHQDASVDLAELQQTLESINRQVLGRIAMGSGAGGTESDAIPGAPLEGSGWRLWTFWAVDSPETEGLAEALVQVRGSGLATVKLVHLAALRHWERWMFRQNTYREAMLMAVKEHDQAKCTELGAAWKAELQPFMTMITTFYGGRGPLMVSDTRAAIALRVETVPSFRLISQTGRVHALDGFGPGFDLRAWITNCQAWEEAEVLHGRRAP